MISSSRFDDCRYTWRTVYRYMAVDKVEEDEMDEGDAPPDAKTPQVGPTPSEVDIVDEIKRKARKEGNYEIIIGQLALI